MQPQGSTYAEVVSVDEAVLNFDLFAFNADVGNPVLAAAVRASCDVQLQVLIETGQALFEFFDQPAGKTLGLGDRQLAEFRSAARDGAAEEGGTADAQADRVELFRQRIRIDLRHVDDEQVLHVGGSQLAAGEPFGEIGSSMHLLGGDAPAQHGCSHVAISRLVLRMNADVIAIDVRGRLLGNGGIELKSNPPLQFFQKTVGSPSMAQEEKLQPCALAMFAQHVGLAEQLGNALDHRQSLIPLHKCVQPLAQIRFSGEPTGYT